MKTTILAAALLASTALPAIANEADSYSQGFAAWQTYKPWFDAQTGDRAAGAKFWSANRSIAGHKTCIEAATDYRAFGDKLTFNAGCQEAQSRLAPIDARRHSDPQYRLGFNDAASGMIHANAPENVTATRDPTNIDPADHSGDQADSSHPAYQPTAQTRVVGAACASFPPMVVRELTAEHNLAACNTPLQAPATYNSTDSVYQPPANLCAIAAEAEAKRKDLTEQQGVNSIDRDRITKQFIADQSAIYRDYQQQANQALNKGVKFTVTGVSEESEGYLKQGGVKIEFSLPDCEQHVKASALVHKMPALATLPEGVTVTIQGQLDPNRDDDEVVNYDLDNLLITKLTFQNQTLALNPVVRTAQEKAADEGEMHAYATCKAAEIVSGNSPWFSWNSPCFHSLETHEWR
jgi:hypothetical protein